MKFKPVRYLHGGLGHAIAKYKKHPGIMHNRKIEAENNERKIVCIRNPVNSVRALLASMRINRHVKLG